MRIQYVIFAVLFSQLPPAYDVLVYICVHFIVWYAVRLLHSQIRINYFVEEGDEIMHGLGKRASSHSVTNYSSPTEETVSSGGCDASVRLAELQEQVCCMSHKSSGGSSLFLCVRSISLKCPIN